MKGSGGGSATLEGEEKGKRIFGKGESVSDRRGFVRGRSEQGLRRLNLLKGGRNSPSSGVTGHARGPGRGQVLG